MTQKTRTPDEAEVKAGVRANPVFVCCAGAGYETVRALRLFMGETSEEAKRQFSELPKADRDEMVDDVFRVISGAEAHDLYAKYDQKGVAWKDVDPIEQVLWVLFVSSVRTQFLAVSKVAEGAQKAMKQAGAKPKN